MNWFKLVNLLLGVGVQAADLFVKNDASRKTANAVIHLVGITAQGLASQNPDGTPATQPYVPPAQEK